MVDADRKLRELIAKAQGDGTARLPPEPRLSEILQVSRGRLRTLLKRLESEGLIWRHVGKGTFVGMRQPDDASLDVGVAVSVDQIIQARFALEPQLAAQAAMHATLVDVGNLEQCLDAMSAAASFADWKRLDDELHLAVAAATHNPLLVVLYDTLKRSLSQHLNVRLANVFGPLETSEPRLRTEQEHRTFVDAIKLHDPLRAEQLMQAHIQSVRTRLFGGR